MVSVVALMNVASSAHMTAVALANSAAFVKEDRVGPAR